MANPNPPLENLTPMKPGETLNPKGRPKGSRNRGTIIREAFEMLEGDHEGKKIPSELAVVLKQVKKALGGDLRATEWLYDGKYGKIPNKQEHSGEEGGPIRFQVKRYGDDDHTAGEAGGGITEAI